MNCTKNLKPFVVPLGTTNGMGIHDLFAMPDYMHGAGQIATSAPVLLELTQPHSAALCQLSQRLRVPLTQHAELGHAGTPPARYRAICVRTRSRTEVQ